MSAPHKTVPVLVWTDIDEGIADAVRRLNAIPGVRTVASCQGTIGEGGPEPYRAQVMASWPSSAVDLISAEFDITPLGENWGYLHPRDAIHFSDCSVHSAPAYVPGPCTCGNQARPALVAVAK